jgi:hypothetical protein
LTQISGVESVKNYCSTFVFVLIQQNDELYKG